MRKCLSIVVIAIFAIGAVGIAVAQREAVLLNIGGADGRTPYAPSCGKISPQAASKSWEKLGCNMKALSPSDPAVYQYFGLAEELDIPVAIHMGTGGSGRANITVLSFNSARIDLLKGVSLTSQDQ